MRYSLIALSFALLGASVWFSLRTERGASRESAASFTQPGIAAVAEDALREPSELAAEEQRVSTKAGEREAVAISGPRPTTLAVRVLNERGEPFRRSELWVEPLVDDFRRSVEELQRLQAGWRRPDAKGVVRFPVAPDVALRLVADGSVWTNYGWEEVLVEPLSAGETRRLEVVLEPPPGSFHGLVLDAAERSPLVGVSVARSVGIPGESTFESFAETDEQGRFELALVDHGSDLLTLEAPGFAPLRFQVDENSPDPSTPRVLELEPAAGLRGRVLGLDVSQPLPTVWLEGKVFESRGFSQTLSATGFHTANVSAEGEYAFDGLEPDVAFRLRVRAAGRTLLERPEPITLFPGESRELDLRLAVPNRVTVRARDAQGRPVPEAKLALFPELEAADLKNHRHLFRRKRWFVTDLEGEAVLESVAAGRWLVAPAEEDWRDERISNGAPLLVEPGTEEALVLVEFSDPSWIRGRCTGLEGGTPGSVTVTAEGSQRYRSATVKADGTFAVGPLAPGTHRVFARCSDAAVALVCEEVLDVAADAEDVVFAFEPAAELELRLVGSDGQAVKHGFVLADREGSPSARRLSLSGRDEPLHVLPGRYTLTAGAEGAGAARVSGIEVEAGQRTTLEVQLEPAATLRVRVVRSAERALEPLELEVLQGPRRVATHALGLGSTAILEVPSATSTVRLGADDGSEEVREKTVVATAGETGEVVFEW